MAWTVSLEIGGFDSILKDRINEWTHAEKDGGTAQRFYRHFTFWANVGGQEALAAWSCQPGMKLSMRELARIDS